MEGNNTKNHGKLILLVVIILIAVVLLVIAVTLVAPKLTQPPEEEPEIITVATLENIIEVSELSTYTAVYNGVAQVNNPDKPENIDYYVSYEARVKAGIDFEQIVINVDNEEKTIEIILPEVYITHADVDISTLDYIFMNDKANTSTVTQEAYAACEADADAECEQQAKIFELATQNAENIVTALIEPFIAQLDEEYELVVH